MKPTHTAIVWMVAALILGVAAMTMTSGCQPPGTSTTDDAQPSAQPSAQADDASQPADDDGHDASDQDLTSQQQDDQPTQVAVDQEIDTSKIGDKSANPQIEKGNWPQWGGTSYRNNTPVTGAVPTTWDIGKLNRETGEWSGSENIKWVAALGSQSYGNVVVAQEKVFAGTNNYHGYLKRYSSRVDLGCLICFRESDGEFLWQHSSEKLPTGRVHDWENQGICCAPLVEGNRLWFVSSRGLVLCLDVEGYYDGKDDGPVTGEQARIFNVNAPIEPEDENLLKPAQDALQEGKLNDYMRSQFARVDMELSEEFKLDGDGPWQLEAEVGGSPRQFKLRMEGNKLAVYKTVTTDDKFEADTIWSFDMMDQLGVSQHNMCSCSITSLGDVIFVNTSNGVDESHKNIPAPDAPSFIAMDKNTGEVLWTDGSPGLNILHGQWSSPTIANLGGVDQVIFGGGDGWVYSFKADRGNDGKPTLLWKFDGNPKTSEWILGGRGTRNNIIATPVIYDGLVYVAVGQDPEHGEGIGHLWCIDPTKKMDGSDVSPQLAMKVEGDTREPLKPRRIQAVIEEDGEVAVDNPDSAVVWHYSEYDQNGDGEFDFEETMHRSCGTVAIQNDILFIADFSGLFHCLNAKTGKPYWTYDMLAAAWGSPLIADGKVYIGDEDGDICIFNISKEAHEPITELNMDNSVYSTPIVANGILYISNRSYIFAIEDQATGD